jgi:hypothetical protein
MRPFLFLLILLGFPICVAPAFAESEATEDLIRAQRESKQALRRIKASLEIKIRQLHRRFPNLELDEKTKMPMAEGVRPLLEGLSRELNNVETKEEYEAYLRALSNLDRSTHPLSFLSQIVSINRMLNKADAENRPESQVQKEICKATLPLAKYFTSNLSSEQAEPFFSLLNDSMDLRVAPTAVRSLLLSATDPEVLLKMVTYGKSPDRNWFTAKTGDQNSDKVSREIVMKENLEIAERQFTLLGPDAEQMLKFANLYSESERDKALRLIDKSYNLFAIGERSARPNETPDKTRKSFLEYWKKITPTPPSYQLERFQKKDPEAWLEWYKDTIKARFQEEGYASLKTLGEDFLNTNPNLEQTKQMLRLFYDALPPEELNGFSEWGLILGDAFGKIPKSREEGDDLIKFAKSLPKGKSNTSHRRNWIRAHVQKFKSKNPTWYNLKNAVIYLLKFCQSGNPVR